MVVKKDALIYLAAFVFVVVADTITKIWIRKFFTAGNTDLFFRIGVYNNERGFFGLSSLQPVLILGIIFLIFVFFVFARSTNFNEKLACLLLAAGGFSNLFERIFYGRTTDIFILRNIGACNLADLSVVCGLLLLLLWTWKKNKI